MYKVKLSFPYPEWDLKRQTPQSSCIWGDYQFFINDDIKECDFWFVFNYLPKKTETVNCPKENTVLITAEAFVLQEYHQSFLDQFSHVITCQREIKHKQVTYFVQGHPWFVGARYRNGHYSDFSKGYDELTSIHDIKKPKSISIITSDKQFTEGHKRRYEFAHALKDYFGSAIDLYGRGIRDFEDKWDALVDYKYSIAIENCVCPDWITEKLFDCYLSHTFPLYYGAPNVTDYFGRNSFELINIENIDQSKHVIEKILNDQGHYEAHVRGLFESKDKCLNQYNIFPIMASFCDKKLNTGGSHHVQTISNTPLANLPLPVRVLKKINYAFQRMKKN